MKFQLALAWKNLFRHRRRTLITACAIAAGLAMFIYMDSILSGISLETERNLVWYETGGGKIMKEMFWEERDQYPIKHSIENKEAIFSVLEEMAIPATGRVAFSGEMIMFKDPFPEHGSIQMRFAAIDPEKDKDVYKLHDSVVEGRWLETGENGILLGAWLAEDLGAEVGYPVTVVTRTKHGFFQTMDLTIVGLLNTPNPQINRSIAYMTLGTADTYLQMEGAVSEIAMAFSDITRAPERTAEVETALQEAGLVQEHELKVVSWKDLARDYLQIASAKNVSSKVILFLVFVIAAVGISNTMLMAVYERVRELGMMRALGMEAKQIRRSFLLEAGGIGLLGSILGVIAGVLINIPMVNRGIDISMFARDMDIGYRVAGAMRGTWNVSTIITAFLAGILIAVVVAAIPTRKALKMEITDCLRYQ